MKYLLFLFTVLSVLSCSNDKAVENTGHTNDTISLSLFDINLGDSIDCIFKQFPDVYEVGLDSISYYLPLKKELGSVYEEMGISIYAVDTTFVIDHRQTKKSYTHNGAHFDFPYDFTEHPAILTIFIKNDHVLQLELFVAPPFGKERYGDYFPNHECGPTVLQMYKNKYGECDSILYVSKDDDKFVTLSVNASEEECEKAIDFVGYNYKKSFLWQWKNAQILVQDRFEHRIIENHINFWALFRVLYTDLEAVNIETQRLENEKINEENRIEREKQIYQNQLKESLSNQDM